jgi:hypothetical protein
MTQDEIIEMARQANATEIGHKPPAFHFYLKDLEVFTKLVEDKTRQELREEIIYKWVPPHFVDLAVKKEREACADLCDQMALYTGVDCADAIRNK